MKVVVSPQSLLSGQTMARHRFLRNPHSPISSCSSSFWAPPCLHCARAVVKPFLALIPSSRHICVNSCAGTTEVAVEAPEWPGCSPQHSHQGRYPWLQPKFQLGAPVPQEQYHSPQSQPPALHQLCCRREANIIISFVPSNAASLAVSHSSP